MSKRMSHEQYYEGVDKMPANQRPGRAFDMTGQVTLRCPFHEEKTPSLVIKFDADKYEWPIFHCFGCGAKGEYRGSLLTRTDLPAE